MASVPDAIIEAATARLADEFGFHVTFGDHVRETGPLKTGPVAGRVADLHAAFADPDVALVLALRGGYHSHQLLPHLDYDLIAANPKAFCGYSDITALQAALLARCDLVTYSGPVFNTFAIREPGNATVEFFRRCLFGSEPVNWHAGEEWFSDDSEVAKNAGWLVLQPGTATGRLTGGNLITLGLLQGSAYWPDLDRSVLVVEASGFTGPAEFDQLLTSLLQTGAAPRAVLIGRFHPKSKMTSDLLAHIVATKPQLHGLPVLADLDVGHTNPLYTFPVGGECYLAADPGAVEVALTVH
jgi:muramoyltetrapeptide carboxypeptidase LdcA involved in peptidoglycan recycling